MIKAYSAILLLLLAAACNNSVNPGNNLTSIQTMQKTSTNEILIITLNMHTYQETDQSRKFDLITDTINYLDADIVLLQECAQHKDSSIVSNNIRQDNMALILTQRLFTRYGRQYHFVWDWAHYGWSVYEEGIAILSKTPFTASEGRYVSSSTSTANLNSRKVIFARTKIPNVGNLNIFCAHLSGWDNPSGDEQVRQNTNTRAMLTEKAAAYPGEEITILGGDFNMQATDSAPYNIGYTTLMSSGDLIDTFLSANPTANNLPENSIFDTIKGAYPGRIDYIFMGTNSQLSVIDSKIIFTSDLVGQVSDHYGVVTKIRKD